jgi:methyl-accepting chemotaxis protein
MQANSIRLKLTVGVATLLILSISAMAALAWYSMNGNNKSAVEELTQSLRHIANETLIDAAKGSAADTSAILDRYFDVTKNFAALLSGSAIGSNLTPYPREQVKAMAGQLLEVNSGVSSIYGQFEPNGYDGLDSSFSIKDEHSSQTGTMEIYWIREEDSVKFVQVPDASVKYKDTKNEFGVREAEWFLCSRDKKIACIMEPYLWEITPGKQVLLTSLVSPILVKSEFRGVAGVDINLPVLQKLIEQQADTLYDGQASIHLISKYGVVIASSDYSNQLGSSLKDLDLALSEHLKKNSSGVTLLSGNLLSVAPVQLVSAESGWSVVVSVPEAVAMEAARQLGDKLHHNTNSVASDMVGFGIALIVIFVFLTAWWLTSITGPLVKMSRVMKSLSGAEGDLTQELERSSHSELNEMADGFNLFTRKLREMISALKQSSSSMKEQSVMMLKTADQTQSAVSIQTSEVQNVASAMHEMTATAHEVAKLAGSTANGAQESLTALTSANLLFQKTVEAFNSVANEFTYTSQGVNNVAQSSQKINGIIDVIQAIAEQTNLLALNAAIEAARAGEQGRGFAVVADEVRSLAARTHSSTDEIKTLIQELQKQVKSSVEQIQTNTEKVSSTLVEAENSSKQLAQVTEGISAIADNAFQVASAAEEQNQVSEEINRNITAIDDAIRALGLQVKHSQLISQQVDAITANMDAQLNKLKSD